MTAAIVVSLYLGVGAVAVVIVRPRGGAGRVAVMVVLWPFLLPTAALTGPNDSSTPLGMLATRVEQALTQARGAAEREKKVLREFVARISASERRLQELDLFLPNAPAQARERLTGLRVAAANDVARGLQMLEELHTHLAVLHFAPAPTHDREMDELLARLEALTDLVSGAP